jgi:hypothetical protein
MGLGRPAAQKQSPRGWRGLVAVSKSLKCQLRTAMQAMSERRSIRQTASA